MSALEGLAAKVALCLLGAAVAVGAACVLYISGKNAGEALVAAEWDAAVTAAEVQRAAVDAAGVAEARSLREKLAALEARNVALQKTRKAALAQPVVCPASGAVGDLLLPAAYVDSLFNGTDRARAPEASASASDSAVQ